MYDFSKHHNSGNTVPDPRRILIHANGQWRQYSTVRVSSPCDVMLYAERRDVCPDCTARCPSPFKSCCTKHAHTLKTRSKADNTVDTTFMSILQTSEQVPLHELHCLSSIKSLQIRFGSTRKKQTNLLESIPPHFFGDREKNVLLYYLEIIWTSPPQGLSCSQQEQIYCPVQSMVYTMFQFRTGV